MRGRPLRALIGVLVAATAAWGAATVLAQQGAEGVDFSAVAGQEFTARVATFASGSPAEDFDVSIDWGDGTQGPATVAQVLPCSYPDANCYEVTGTHTYASPGSYQVETDIAGPDGGAGTESTATVSPQQPPPPGGPTPEIALAKPEVKPGEPAIIDASGSIGDIALFAFDLNGNGTYETKGPSPVASVVHTVPGGKRIGVQVVGSNGQSATAEANLTVTGTPLAPPGGQQPFKEGTVTGSLHNSSSAAGAEALIKNYNCPRTVQVGVAEATMAPTWGEVCFERQTKSGLKHPAYPRFLGQGNQALINGLHVLTTGRVLISEGLKWIQVQTPGSAAGKADIELAQPPGYGGAFSPSWEFGKWDVSTPGTVTTFPGRLSGSELLGLPVAKKATPIKFTAGHRSEFQAFVLLPFSEFTLWPENPPTGKPFTLRASNSYGLDVEGGYSYAFDLPLGIFNLKGGIAYSLEGGSHVWSGNFSLRIPDTPVNADGQIKFRDGELEQASVHVPFDRPGLPIGCCIYLVGLDGKLTSDDIEASATFAAGPTLIGDFRAAEATATVNWNFSPFLLVFKADNLKIAKFDVNANAQVMVSKSMFLAFAFWDDSFGPLSMQANVEVRIGDPWYVAGGGTACFEVLIEGCAVVHAAAGPNGIAACGTVLGVGGGLRVPWNPLNFDDWHGWFGCSFGKVKTKVGASQAAAIRARASAAGAAAASYRVRVTRGLRGGLFAIRGQGSQPQVSLRSPGGKLFVIPAGEDTARGPGWFATSHTNDGTTYFGLTKPAAGVWRVSELPGSPAVRSIGFAEALPRRFARGRVSGRGRTRTLHYKLARSPGTRVTFVERGGRLALGDGEKVVERVLGRARGRSGRIRFVPSEAKLRRRRIEAVVESGRTAIKTETVARFTAARFRLPAPPRVRARRAGRALLVGWPRVTGARTYQAFVNRSDGETRYFRRSAGKRRIRINGISGLTSARIEVRAISAAGYIGRAGHRRLRALRPVELSGRQRLGKVLHAGGFRVRCTAAADGACEIAARKGRRTLGRGARRMTHAQTRRVFVKLTPAGRKALRSARRSRRAVALRVVTAVPGAGTPTLRVRFR